MEIHVVHTYTYTYTYTFFVTQGIDSEDDVPPLPPPVSPPSLSTSQGNGSNVQEGVPDSQQQPSSRLRNRKETGTCKNGKGKQKKNVSKVC